MMTQLGSSQEEIDHFTETYLNIVDTSQANSPSNTNIFPYLIPVYQDMVGYENSQLDILNGESNLDATPPISSIQLDGILGLNNWYISNVSITLSAEDNFGGSGIQKIEWSLDNGRTWNTYSGPFIHSQEGIFHLIARATDNEGNIEYPPTETNFKVDKTPPVMNVWTDQTQYTRVDPFVVHYNAQDPEPGSGIAQLTANFNGQPVTDGQVIDLFSLDLGSYTLSATAEDYAGWVTSNSVTIELIATIQSLQATVDRFCQEGSISNQGTCQSLWAKLDAALEAQNRGQAKTAVNILGAFQNEVNAQTDKHIPSEVARILLMDSDSLIQALGGP